MMPRILLALLLGLVFGAVPEVSKAQDVTDLDRQFHSHWKSGKYKEAQAVAERMRSMAEANPNTSPHNLAGCLANLADVYSALGKLKIPNAWWEWNASFNMFRSGTTEISDCMRKAIDSYNAQK